MGEHIIIEKLRAKGTRYLLRGWIMLGRKFRFFCKINRIGTGREPAIIVLKLRYHV